MTISTDEPMSNGERDKLMSKAYTSAGSDLRRRHQAEFNKLYQDHCAEFGIHWVPKPTKDDKALEDVVKLLDEHPGLAERLARRLREDKVHEGDDHDGRSEPGEGKHKAKANSKGQLPIPVDAEPAPGATG